MRSGGKTALALIGLATLALGTIDSAEARRFRFFHFGGGASSQSEKIDLVYDLPNREPYQKYGENYDIGYLYSTHSGARALAAEPQYVLYHDNRYIKLGPAELALITDDLGLDPTAAYHARYIADLPKREVSRAEIARLPGESDEQFRARIRTIASMVKPTPSAEAGRRTVTNSALTSSLGGMLLLILFGWIATRMLRRRPRPAATEAPDAADSKPDTDSFDARLERRLRELREEGSGGDGGEGAPPAVRPTFGKRAPATLSKGGPLGPEINGVPVALADNPVIKLLFPETGKGEPAPPPPPPPPSAPPEDEAADDMVDLASFTMLTHGEAPFDWAPIDAFLAKFDPGHGWERVTVPSGMGIIHGRGTITIAWVPQPVEMRLLADCLHRSFWFKGDPDRLSRHSQQLGIFINSPPDFESRRQVAMIASVVMGLMARAPHFAALINNQVDTIYDIATLEKLVAIVGSEEIPIQLWAWVAPDSLVDGNVCMSTGGLEPFLGYELEVWNAPFPARQVREDLNEMIRYLLIHGPVVSHGDTIGRTRDDQSIRCFFGESRAQREQPVKAMFLEFGEPVAAMPKPDPLPVRNSREGFGRKQA